MATFSYTLHGYFCRELLLQSHAALHGEFLLVLHTQCWFMQEAPLVRPSAGLYGELLLHQYMPSAGLYAIWGVTLTSIHAQCWFIWGVTLTSIHAQCWFIWGVTLACPVLVYVLSFSYTPHAGFFLWGVSLIRSMLASLCREFLLYKTKRTNVKVNKNVHN